jgi:predicted NBD/HSP70 family sugar kinase
MMSGRINHAVMRDRNRALVLEVIRRDGPVGRAQVARATDLGKPAVSAIVDDLLRGGRVREAGRGTTGVDGGRPSVLLEFEPTSEAYLAAQIGVHTTTVVVADGAGAIRATRSAASIRGDGAAGTALLGALADGVLADAGTPRHVVRSAGLALPGLINRRTGMLDVAPNLGWHAVEIERAAADALGVPVTVHNITQAAAFAESRFGAAAGTDSFVWVYAGSGIGAAIVMEGELLLGARGLAGEIGHCRVVEDGPACGCGGVGCLETVASGLAVERAGRAAATGRRRSALRGRDGVTTNDVLEAAAAGDVVSAGILREAGSRLGRGISYLIRITDPDLVVVGGPLAEAGELLLDPIRRALRLDLSGTDPVPVVGSAVGDHAPLTGALLLAMDAGGAPLPARIGPPLVAAG